MEEGDIDAICDESLQYVADGSQSRVTFAANGQLWALRFHTQETYKAFVSELSVGDGWGTYHHY